MGQGGVKVEGGGCRKGPHFRKAGVHATYPQPPDNHSTHRIEKAKEEAAYER